MADPFENHEVGLNSPYDNVAPVTPDDATDLATTTRGFYVGGAGDVVVDMARDGTSITLAGATAGSTYAFRVKRVRSTGTTATNIEALW